MATLRIASFDIGRKNFAHYVEDVRLTGPGGINELEKRYKALPKTKRRRVKGVLEGEIREIVADVCMTGTSVHHGVVDLRANPENKKLDVPTRFNLFSYLKSLQHVWATCDVIAIEQQYFSTFTPRGRKMPKTEANIDAIKLAENCWSFFALMCPPSVLFFYGSSNKTKIMGAPLRLSSYQRKRWAVVKMKEILGCRSETALLAELETLKKSGQKLDDISDCVVMTQAIKLQKMVFA